MGIDPKLGDGVDGPALPRDEYQRRRISGPLAPLSNGQQSLLNSAKWLNFGGKGKREKKRKETCHVGKHLAW